MCYHLYILILVVMGIGFLVVGTLNVLGTYTSYQQLGYLQCKWEEGKSGFYDGNQGGWVGVNNMDNAVIKMRLGFMNNIRQMRNGLRGFTTNLTLLGIPTNAVYTTMKLNLQTNLLVWLTRNSSASTTQAPICQPIPFSVPSPVNNLQKV